MVRRSDVHSMKGCACVSCEARRATRRAYDARRRADPTWHRKRLDATKRWAQTPEGREYHRAYKRRDDYRAQAAAYARSPRGKESRQRSKARYNASPKGREAQRRDDARRRAREADKPKLAARKAVAKAIAKGKLVRPAVCGRCGASGPLEAHHHRGYDREHRLDVVFLCRDCHRAEEA